MHRSNRAISDVSSETQRAFCKNRSGYRRRLPHFALRIGNTLAHWGVAFLFQVWAVNTVCASDDYLPDNTSWNGLSDFISSVVEKGIPIDIPQRIEPWTLSPEDALLIIHPIRSFPILELTSFMKRGGRIAILDDFGASEHIFHAFHFSRYAPPKHNNLMKLRGNEELLIAIPVTSHPLTENVTALVTNHPQVLFHSELNPIFAFDKGKRAALLYTGAIGEGRLIIAADASLLINNMMNFRGNRIFSNNLVKYLTNNYQGRLHLILQNAEIASRDTSILAHSSLHQIRQGLLILSQLHLPPNAVYLLTIAVSAFLLIATIASLPRGSPYISRSHLFRRPVTLAGLLGRVHFFSSDHRNLLQPVLVFKFEFEAAISKLLGLPHQASLQDIETRLLQLGIPQSEIKRLHQLVLELDDLHLQQDRPSHPPEVKKRKFQNIVSTGSYILSLIEEAQSNRK